MPIRCEPRRTGFWRASRRKPDVVSERPRRAYASTLAVTGSLAVCMKQEGPGGIHPGAFYLIAAAPDGQPVGGVRSAAPAGYHYTLDHLLPLGPPRPPPGTVRRRRALIRRATVARHDWSMIR